MKEGRDTPLSYQVRTKRLAPTVAFSAPPAT